MTMANASRLRTTCSIPLEPVLTFSLSQFVTPLADIHLDGGETGDSDSAYDLEEVNRMLTNSVSAKTAGQSPKKPEPPAKAGNTNQVETAGEPEKKGGMMTYFSGMLAALIVLLAKLDLPERKDMKSMLVMHMKMLKKCGMQFLRLVKNLA